MKCELGGRGRWLWKETVAGWIPWARSGGGGRTLRGFNNQERRLHAIVSGHKIHT